MSLIPKKKRNLIARLSHISDEATSSEQKEAVTLTIMLLQELKDKHYQRGRRRVKRRISKELNARHETLGLVEVNSNHILAS